MRGTIRWAQKRGNAPLTRAFGATSPRTRGEVNKANAPPPLLFDGRGAARVPFSVLERMERREAPGVCETPLTELARLRCRAPRRQACAVCANLNAPDGFATPAREARAPHPAGLRGPPAPKAASPILKLPLPAYPPNRRVMSTSAEAERGPRNKSIRTGRSQAIA